ncbi:hypothetical protein [Brevundimonas terrae]|uniref:hypothetical protein n=1 Tax=Brevundimonas terrae TaxID=363631 RepID=UPI001421387F|nr:hypothetical protein [Brevundimonas terrae]NIJ26962.1 hypothetical protein [Brevundimonas terrae]
MTTADELEDFLARRQSLPLSCRNGYRLDGGCCLKMSRAEAFNCAHLTWQHQHIRTDLIVL